MRRIIPFIALICFSFGSYATSTGDTIQPHNHKKRLPYLLIGMNTTYVSSIVALDLIWYKNQPRSLFHFFNDNNEWLQIDKIGHATTAFHESVFCVNAYKWAGVSERKAIIWGSLAGFLYQSPIEILDGFSSQYGASWGDLTANASGSLLVLGQYLLWNDIRIQPKFSFHRTKFASVRPSLLGNGLNEEWLKDYNGQTYWLSFNIYSFLNNKESLFPKWINLSLGYGIENMVSADKNQSINQRYTPYRQYFLSFDFDLSKVKTRKKWVKTILYPLNFIHIPFPAIELGNKKIKLHPLYF